MTQVTIQSLQENAKYCVTLILKTVIHKSKLLGFQNFESLAFDIFLSKTEKKSCFLADTNYTMLISKCKLVNGWYFSGRYSLACSVTSKMVNRIDISCLRGFVELSTCSIFSILQMAVSDQHLSINYEANLQGILIQVNPTKG